MRITEVEPFIVRAPGHLGAYGGPYGALVRVSTDEGIVGWGEADTLPEVFKTIIEAPFQDELMSGLRALLVGQDPRDPLRQWVRMWRGTSQYGRGGAAVQAMAAVDIALWDIAGKAAGKPVHQLLGAPLRDRLRVYGTHPLGATPAESAANARKVVERGLTAVKMGWSPLGPDADADEAIVKAIRQAVGPDIAVLIDGGNAWNADQAIERCRRFAPYGLHWFEEPLHPEDIEGYRRLIAAAPGMTIAAGELCATAAELLRLIGAGVHVIQIDLARVGLTQGLRVAEAAAQAGARIVNHTYTLDCNLAASLHLMAVAPAVDLCEVQVLGNPVREALFPRRLWPEGGWLKVPTGPGLGVEPHPDGLRRFG